jgi:hypothetical protein
MKNERVLKHHKEKKTSYEACDSDPQCGRHPRCVSLQHLVGQQYPNNHRTVKKRRKLYSRHEHLNKQALFIDSS